jgi:hypothetical protein
MKPTSSTMKQPSEMTPHELHRRLRENGYSPTVTEDTIESYVKPFKETLTNAMNAALGDGEDRAIVILIDGILGDISAAVATSDSVHPDLVDFLKARKIQ